MDAFDGIFAGKKKRLKAMKDGKVGSFGVQSLVFITLIQIACILKIQNLLIFVLPISLFWGRFSNLFLLKTLNIRAIRKNLLVTKSIGMDLKRIFDLYYFSFNFHFLSISFNYIPNNIN